MYNKDKSQSGQSQPPQQPIRLEMNR